MEYSIFQLKTRIQEANGQDFASEFIKNGYIGIGYPAMGDLTDLTSKVIKERLEIMLRDINADSPGQFRFRLGVINTFLSTKIGDVILVQKGDVVHIGKIIGEYEYHPNEFAVHQKKVSWSTWIEKYYLNDKVRELLKNRSTITKFKYCSDLAEFDELFESSKISKEAQYEKDVNKDLILKALDILKDALDSANETTRIHAASSILSYYKK